MENYLFTSESVTSGHPDKIADQISDAILDECLSQDNKSRVACETLVTTGQVIVAGEISTKAHINIQKIVRNVIRDIGYNNCDLKFTDSCGILNIIDTQSEDIALGVDVGGAGDQGMVFGGAINETKDLMPLPISLARALTTRLTKYVKTKIFPWGRPDGKSQVTIAYEDGKPVGIDTIVISAQHNPNIDIKELRNRVKEDLIYPVVEEYGFNPFEIKNIHINPTGRFVIGGPHGDVGLTGRKIIVDTYGGYFNCGGGAFSGKDPTKVDRSGAYMARYIAKNIVASGLAEKCEVQLSYAIGIAEPISVNVNCFDTNYIPSSDIEKAIHLLFDMTPLGIIKEFELSTFKNYRDLAAYGHFGRDDSNYPWEKVDKVDKLLNFFR